MKRKKLPYREGTSWFAVPLRSRGVSLGVVAPPGRAKKANYRFPIGCSARKRFLTAARATPELSAVPVGRARLELLQNEEISTPGGLMYDDFFGHVDDPLPPDPLPRELYEVPPDYE